MDHQIHTANIWLRTSVSIQEDHVLVCNFLSFWCLFLFGMRSELGLQKLSVPFFSVFCQSSCNESSSLNVSSNSHSGLESWENTFNYEFNLFNFLESLLVIFWGILPLQVSCQILLAYNFMVTSLKMVCWTHSNVPFSILIFDQSM